MQGSAHPTRTKGGMRTNVSGPSGKDWTAPQRRHIFLSFYYCSRIPTRRREKREKQLNL